MEKSEIQDLYCCICSVSLSKDEAISVFHENNGSLFEKIKKCLPFIISRTTKLNMYMCKTCLTELDISYRLIEKALKTSNILRLQITTDKINSLDDEKCEQQRNNITTIDRVEKKNELVEGFEYCEVEIVSQEVVNGSDVENISEENKNTDDEFNDMENVEVINIDLENMDREEQRTKNTKSQENNISPSTKNCVMLENSESRKLSVNDNKNRYCGRVQFTEQSYEQNGEDERSFESDNSTLSVILRDRKKKTNSPSRDTSRRKSRSGSFMIECSVCKLIFHDKDKFLLHGCVKSDSEHAVNAYVCHYCDFVFSCVEALKFHLQFNHVTKEANRSGSDGHLFGADIEKLHTNNFIESLATSNDEQYACTCCHGTFKSFEYLRRHINRRHKDFQICNSCRMIIKGGYKNLVDHQLQHCEYGTGYKYKCGQCDEKFTNYMILKKHLKVEHNLRFRYWTCTFCGKETCSKSSLMAHERTHTGLKPFQCKLCPKQFRSKPNLVQHSFTHTLVKRFLCDICQRSFSRKSYLVVHMRKHTGERPYACDICGHLYTQIGVLRRHRTKHFCVTVLE